MARHGIEPIWNHSRRNCPGPRGDLQLEGRIKTLKEFIDRHPDTTEPMLNTNIRLRLIEIDQIGGTTMIYERPDIQLLYALHAPGDQSISPVGKDLRARESKEFTDSNAGRDPLNLSDVSKQVALPTSAHQAHWVFQRLQGKSRQRLRQRRRLARAAEQSRPPHTAEETEKRASESGSKQVSRNLYAFNAAEGGPQRA